MYNDVLNAVVSTIQGLAMPGMNAIIKRKLPSAEEVLDTPLPIICVVPSEDPESYEWTSYEGDVTVGYVTQVVLIAAGNQTLTAGLDAMLNWR